jgi:hypothetical protein
MDREFMRATGLANCKDVNFVHEEERELASE